MNERCLDRPISGPSPSLFISCRSARMPLKFGAETMTEVTCARVKLAVADRSGRTAEGWGETPLSVQWVWPSPLSYEIRHSLLKSFCVKLAERWASFAAEGHPMEIGQDFIKSELIDVWKTIEPIDGESLPWLAALVCDSAFDIALHDAFANLIDLPVYQTYMSQFMSRDLAAVLEPAEGSETSFSGRFPSDFLDLPARNSPRVASRRRQRPPRIRRLDRRRAERRRTGPLARLDSYRRLEMPQGQTSRRRCRVGLRPSGSRRSDRDR